MQHLISGGPHLLDAEVVGHKFARQESLRRAGFPVPDFFCVPAAVFDRITAAARPAMPAGAVPGDHQGLLRWSAGAKDAVTAAEPPDGLAEELLAAFDAAFGPDGLVAVRACVVANSEGVAEDGAADPFAGLSDSFLYVGRDELVASVRRCWASAFNTEALLYRARQGHDPMSARVAVGVQRMVCGTRSFVAFTRDPRDGREQRVIAAAHGIGEGVVQEKADVDHFFVVPTTASVRASLVHKTRMVTLDPQRPDAGPQVLPVPTDLADIPVLTDDESRSIAELAGAVESHFGCPQDIEGTITADGLIHLVQARPMTVAADTDGTDTGREIHWSNHNVTESFPGVTSALTFSVALDFYELLFADVYRKLGVPASRLRHNRHHLRRMIGYLDGRVYYRLDAWYTLHGQLALFDLIRPTWQQAVGLTTPGDGSDAAGRASRLRMLWEASRMLGRLSTHRSTVRRFLQWWDGVTASNTNLADRSSEELVVIYRRMWSEMSVRWGVTLVNGFFLLAAMTAVTRLLKRWVPHDAMNLLTGLLTGGPKNRSVAALRSTIALAERVRADEALRTAVLDQPECDVWTALVSGQYGDEVAEMALRHVRAYGDRGLHDLKLEVPTLRQQPWKLLGTLRPLVRQELTVASNTAREHQVRREAEGKLRRLLPNPVRRTVLRILLAVLRWFVGVREDSRFARSQLFGISREVLWRLGADLVDAGMLDQVNDIIDLTADEVIGTFDGTLPGRDLRGLVSHRRAERGHCADRPGLPARLTTAAGRPVSTAIPLARLDETAVTAHGNEALNGLASSSGRVRAPAKIVLDPDISPESIVGHILVARETDPGWLPLMLAAKGLVVERGTLLSHTAIAGRILGVPTVVAVAGATTHIQDGTWIEVDGGAGTVRVLADPLWQDTGADPRVPMPTTTESEQR